MLGWLTLFYCVCFLMALDFEYCVWMAAPERMPGASGNIRSRCGRLENIYNIPHIMLNRRGSNAGGVARLVVAATRVYRRWIKVYFAPCLSAWVLHILSLYSQLTSRRGERATQIARTWGANSLYEATEPCKCKTRAILFFLGGSCLQRTPNHI